MDGQPDRLLMLCPDGSQRMVLARDRTAFEELGYIHLGPFDGAPERKPERTDGGPGGSNPTGSIVVQVAAVAEAPAVEAAKPARARGKARGE